MTDAVFGIHSGQRVRQIGLQSCLDPDASEQAAVRANAWIKSLRHAVVNGEPMRRRFTFRGQSLWWFTEIYLHKERLVSEIFETLAALTTLAAREEPRALTLVRGGRVARAIAPRFAAVRNIPYQGPPSDDSGTVRLARLDARSAWLHGTALASRVRSRAPAARSAPVVGAFIHRAFWRTDAGDGSAEAYIGPVLKAIEERAGAEHVAYVSLGPRSNFTARRWWDPLRSDDPRLAVPVEAYAPLDRLRQSRQLWSARHEMRSALWGSDDLRRRAVIDGCDCWPLIRDELAGVALLQWPWSARAWDEADAALDVLAPRAVVTYAEAGGWGRALMLASRDRGIPSVGLQHGFIYRHWLNYLHEPDEMDEAGFPRPDATAVFDEYAAAHLRREGHFPADSIVVTGSPRLDGLVRTASSLSERDVEEARAAAAPGDGPLVLVTTKFREARGVLPEFLDAALTLPDVRIAIKTHPAETPDVYQPIADGRQRVKILPADAPLAPLLRACRAVATVNSTVALDAAVLDVPAFVIGLPNNLSPFVDAGIMVGSKDDAAGALRRILYDEEFRQQLAAARRAFLDAFAIRSDGRAAARAADVVLQLSGGA